MVFYYQSFCYDIEASNQSTEQINLPHFSKGNK